MVCEQDIIILVIHVLILLYLIHCNWRWGGIVLTTKNVRGKRSSVDPELPSNREAMIHFKFVSEQEDWSLYIERLENFFVANDVVTAEEKHAIQLSVCGDHHHTYRLIRSLTTPITLSLKSYEDLVKLVREHYSPRRVRDHWKFQIKLSYL